MSQMTENPIMYIIFSQNYSGGHFNIKRTSYQYGDSHYNCKSV